MSWLEENLLAVIAVVLALAVVVLAWLLRRSNGSRDADRAGAAVTDEMVKEQLNKINLDLRQAPTDEPRFRK